MTRKKDSDDCPFAQRAFDLNLPGGLAGEAVNLTEAEAGAFADLLGGEEGIKRTLARVFIHADAGVRNCDHDILARLDPFRQRADGGGVEKAICRFNNQLAAARHGVPGVDRQVDERILKLIGIDEGVPKRLGKVGLQRDLLAERLLQQIADAGNQRIGVDGLRRERLLA